jgi:hypothetical protein
MLQVAVGRAKGVFARFGQLFGGIDHIHGALLELHSVTSSRQSHADESLGNVDIAIVIDADFGNDETRLIVANQPVSNLQCVHEKLLLLLSEKGRTIGKPFRLGLPIPYSAVMIAVPLHPIPGFGFDQGY